MPHLLRDYQQQGIENVRNLFFTRKITSGIYHLFTAGGKTVNAAEIVKQLFPLEKNRVMFCAPAISLVFQAHADFKDQWPEIGIAGARTSVGMTNRPSLGIVMEKLNDVDARFIVASVPSLVGDIIAEADPKILPKADYAAIYEKYVQDLPRPEAQAALDRELKQAAIEYYNNHMAPIRQDDLDVTTDPMSGETLIRKSADSKRAYLVSPRVDQILAHGWIKLWIHDEAHHSVSDGTLVMMRRLEHIARLCGLPEPFLIGLTATPVRADNRAMANLYKTIIISRDFRWAQSEGFIAPFHDPPAIRVLAKKDDDKLTTAKKLFNWAQFVFDSWKEKAGDRITAFYCGKLDDEIGAIEASKMLAKYFSEHGVPSVHLDGQMCIGPDGVELGKGERAKFIGRNGMVVKGQVQCLMNYGVLIEGVDVPPIDCVALLRGLNEVQLTQVLGRALRLFAGNQYLPAKKNTLLLDYSGEELNVVPVGTLMGVKINEFGQYEEDDEAEDQLMPAVDGKATTEMIKKAGVVHGKEASYEVAKIIAKSKGDWYHADDGSMSLSVGTQDLMFITVPHLTMVNNLDYLRSEAELAFAGQPVEVAPFKDMPADQLSQYIQLFVWGKQFYENFVLWHVAKTDEGRYVLPTRRWLATHPDLPQLETQAVDYAYHQIENNVEAFLGKNKNWKRKPISDAQKAKLAQLGYVNGMVAGMSMGDASQLITHLLAIRTLTPIFGAIETTLKPFERYML